MSEKKDPITRLVELVNLYKQATDIRNTAIEQLHANERAKQQILDRYSELQSQLLIAVSGAETLMRDALTETSAVSRELKFRDEQATA